MVVLCFVRTVFIGGGTEAWAFLTEGLKAEMAVPTALPPVAPRKVRREILIACPLLNKSYRTVDPKRIIPPPCHDLRGQLLEVIG